MKFWLGVENFAKIEHAKICINEYTVLVGENNSGKTFLMQLVQGISEKLAYLVDGTIMEHLLVYDDNTVKECIINAENISILVEHINIKLVTEKESIVRDIFGREIPIEKLYIDALIEDNESYCLLLMNSNAKKDVEKVNRFHNKLIELASTFVEEHTDAIACVVARENLKNNELTPISVHLTFRNAEWSVFKNALNSIMGHESLFLPASRTGLLLLYREFFANRKDEEISFKIRDDKFIEDENKIANLTKPVYEFLRFLQTYLEDEERKTSKELSFFEEHLIEGHISLNKQEGLFYNSKNENEKVPMYLASSMINEVAPLVLAITSKRMFKRLIIDEAEASLHPQKQLELVRFFNRLNNNGMKLIISTHSDTFVSKLNNLYLLSEMVKINGEDILKQFELEKEDLISAENLYVYEVVNKSNGKSVVNEINADKNTGYRFDLFTRSAIHIYEEATKLGELQ